MIRTMQIINIQILRKSNQNHMIKIHKFLNGVSQVIVNKPVNQKFYLFCQIIIYLQAILYVNTSFSMVHTLTQWSDISNFQQPPKIVIFSFILIIFSTVSIVGKIFFIENRTLTEKPSFFKIYLIRIISYLQMIISSLFLAPLIRATSIIYVDDGSPPLLYIGVISIIVAFILIYPMYLASQSSRLAMVSYRGKLCSLNLQFYFDLLRVILPGASVVSQKLLIVLAFLFIILHAYFSWYYPVLSYRHNNIKQIMMSAITYTCLCKLQNLIDQNSYNNPFIWILGCISFCFMTSSLRSHRVRQILAQKEFTLKKTKILIFLIYNIEQYNEILLAYLLLHHKQCQQAVCYCQNVRSTLYQKEQVNFKQLQKEWYKLVVHFIQSQYNTNKIQALNESSRLLTLKQYTEIALNLSEIHLFKLQQINKSYYILDQYSDICENNRLLSYMSKLEVSILKRQIQEKRRIKSLTKGKMSSKIEQYIRFQVYYQQLKLKMKQSCQKVSLFWVQTLKKEPDQSKIIDILHSVFEQNEKIETSHKHMLLAFSNCQQIIAKALNQYYIHILNIPSDSPFHINRNFTFAKAAVQKKQINARVFQNSDYFGYNSQTPLCFISVDRQNFGEILRYNQFFDRLMKVQYRNCLKIQDLLIPQMRFGHQRKMEAYLKDDNYKLQHNHGITFNKDGYLVYHKIILQNVPSIQNGLKYVVLFKKTCQEKKIFALKNKQNIIYTSQKLVKNCGEGYIKQLKAGLQNNSFYSQLVTTKQSRIKIEGRDEKLLFLSQFNDKENSWLIIEIHEEMNNNQMYTKSTFSQANYLEQQADKAFKFITNYMQDSSQNTHIQNSLVAKENNKRNTLSQSTELQCSDKLQQEMNEAFKILTASTQNGVIKRTIKVYFISGVIILVIIGLSGYLKQQEIKSYELLANTNRAYHKLMLNLNGVAIYSRIITYFSYLNLNIYSTQILFANFISFSQIIASLDDVVKNFNIQQILQDWPAFNCNKKQGTITETKQNNMLSIADFIQNPVTNLISASDYQFSMDKNNTIIPFTTTQCNYFQLILNVQYVTIPNLRKLKKDRLNSLLISSIQMSPFQIFLFSFAITIIFLFLILMHVFKNIILIAKHVIFDIYQKTDCLFRKNRLDRCQYYLMKNQIKCKSTKNSDVLAEPDENEESSEFQSAISKEIVTEQQGGREVNNQIIYLKQQKTKDSQLNLSQQEYFAKKKDLGIIKSMMFAIPIACCFSSFYYLQFKQAKDIKNALMIQDKLQIMQQNYNFVKIYAMQYVFEQASFQRYLNSRNYINTLAQEIFQIQRNFVDKSEDLSLLPNLAILIEEMAFSNLCDSPLFELRSIPNLCPVVGGGILTKGLYSTIINYVEQAKNLLNLHTNVGNYTFSQKIKYLGSPFFNDGVITIFIDEIFTLLLAEFSSDFKSIGQTKIINYITILLIIATYCLIFGVVNAISTVKDMKKHLRQIKIVTILISLDSFKKDSTLKTLFSNSFEKFDKLN